jgi:O-antigen ligase
MSNISTTKVTDFSFHDWRNLLVSGALYACLAIGSFSVNEFDWLRLLAMSTAAGLGIFLVSRRQLVSAYDVLVLLSLAVVLLVQYARTNNIDLALAKIDGAVAGSIVTFFLARGGYQAWGEKSIASFVQVATGVLALTIVFKFAYGLNDREVRFFLNGPIVFAWLMGLAFLLSLHLCLRTRRLWYGAMCAVFIAAIIWSGSKGPLIATMAGFVYLLSKSNKLKYLAFSSAVLLGTILLAAEAGILPERLMAFQRIGSGETTEDDFGSVELRQLMWQVSYSMFENEPLTGVGLANWPDHAPGFKLGGAPVTYPHNIALEILSEHGLVGAVALVAILVTLFLKSGALARGIMIFVITALLFSGDAAYWNFLFGLCLGWRKA